MNQKYMQLFVNDLTVIDFSYLCPERGIVGESWIVDIVLDGSLNEQSMVLDFGHVKKQVKRIIDNAVDHKLAIPAEHAFTQVIHTDDQNSIWVDFLRPNAEIHLYCPAEAFAFIDAEQVDKASVIRYLKAAIKREMPENVAAIELELREESIEGPYYHYTHGLKKHDGNCQRIAHGHRSRIQVLLDGERSDAMEQHWAKAFADIYIGSSEDVVALEQLQRSEAAMRRTENDYIGYSYTADQGLFELILPKAENYLMHSDSTVECIAEHLAQATRQLKPSAEQVKVIAYEGVGKGAIGYA